MCPHFNWKAKCTRRHSLIFDSSLNPNLPFPVPCKVVHIRNAWCSIYATNLYICVFHTTGFHTHTALNFQRSLICRFQFKAFFHTGITMNIYMLIDKPQGHIEKRGLFQKTNFIISQVVSWGFCVEFYVVWLIIVIMRGDFFSTTSFHIGVSRPLSNIFKVDQNRNIFG